MSIFEDYKKYLDLSCDKAGKVYVNVCGSDANFYHFIPLNEYADCDITNIGLVYSYNDRNTNGIFGKGFRLSIFSRLEHVSNNSITLYNNDFSEDIYNYDSNTGRFINEESGTYIIYESDKYRLYDKFDNYFEYNPNHLDYPSLYYNKDENRITTLTEYISNNLVVINGINSTRLELYYNSNKVTQLSIIRLLDEFDQDDDVSPQTVLDVYITYNSDNISQIEYIYYKNPNITHTISMGLNSNGTKYIASDDISTKKVEVSITNNKVSGIRSGFNSAISYSRYLYFAYNTYYTRVYSSDSDTNNKRKIDNYYYFDDENKLMYSFNKEGIAQYREYNNLGKLIYESNIEYTDINQNTQNTHLDNLVQNSYFNNGTSNYVISSSSSVSVVSNTDFPNHLGSYMLHVEANSGFYLYQDINIKGKCEDIFTLNLWYSYGNYYSSATALPSINIIFYEDSNVVDDKTINLKTILRNRSPFFQSKEVRSSHSFNKIRIKLIFNSSLSMYINGICLYKRGEASNINYIDDYNIQKISTSNQTNEFTYYSDNKIKEVLTNTSDYTLTKEENNLKTIKGLNNTKEELVKAKKGTVINRKTYFSDSNKYIEEQNTYYQNRNYHLTHNYLLQSVDSNNNTINYTYNYDTNNNIIDKAMHTPSVKVINSNIKYEYEYDYKQRINKIKESNYNDSTQNKTIEIEYDSNDRLSYIKCPNNMKYEYEYGTYSSADNANLIKVKYSNNGNNAVVLKEMSYYRDGNNINTDLLNESTINSCTSKYEYDEYYNIENIKKNNILKHHFEYYDKEIGGLLQNTYNYFYTNNTLTDTFRKNYEYDNMQRIKEKKYYKNNNLKETINYLYDKDDLIGIINDNGNNSANDVNCMLQTYDSKTKMRGVNLEAVKKYLYNNDVYNCFFNEKRDGDSDIFKYGNLLRENQNGLIEEISLNTESSGNISNEGFIRYVNNPRLSYNVSVNTFTVQFYFKITQANSNKFLFSIGSSNSNKYVGIKISTSNKIELVSYFNNTEVINASTNGEVALNEWHNMILSCINSTYTMIIDNDIKIGIISNYSALDNTIHFGYKYANNIKSNYLSGMISFISYENIYYNNIEELYKKKFFLDENVYHNLYINEENKMYTGVDVTTEYIDYNEIKNANSDLFPLTSSFKSIKGKDVLVYEYETPLLLDRDPNFNYNKDAKRYCFESRGQVLKYDLMDIIGMSASTMANIYIDIYPTIKGMTQNLFELKLDSTAIKISINENGYLVYQKDNDNEEVSNVSLDLYNWYHIRLYYNKTINYFKLFNSTTEIFSKYIMFSNINSAILTLGFNDYPFYGQYSNMEVSAGIERISKICASKIIEYNELSLPISEKVVYNNNVRLQKHYNYESISNNKYLTRISEEKIGNDIYSYYYTNNQITEIKKNNQNYKKYTYNYCGYLTSEEDYDLGIKYTYSYDNNGNRLYRLKHNFNNELIEELYYHYDSTYKDKLSYIDGDINYNITYSSTSPYYISYIAINDTDININYEGSNIISYTQNTDTYTFKYNEYNERIEKRISNNEYTTYYYDNHILVREEIYNNYNFKNIYYLYDNNNSIYGFIYDNNRYYYIKDCMQNIIGIIDNLGIKLCDYQYDSFGNVSVVNYNSNIGNINSIRYKGYYYDKEIGLYYCINRYYNPYLGRWLTIDDSKYIDRYNINSLNLFTYCENNPSIESKFSHAISNYSTQQIVNKTYINENYKNSSFKNLYTERYVEKGHITLSIFDSYVLSSQLISSNVLFVNFIDISYTTTIQDHSVYGIYSFTDYGNDCINAGFGFNNENGYGFELYLSSNNSIGYSIQCRNIYYGIEYESIDCFTLSFGTQAGVNSESVNIKIRGGLLALVAYNVPVTNINTARIGIVNQEEFLSLKCSYAY